MTKRKIGEQLSSRYYVEYLQNKIGENFYIKTNYFDIVKTEKEFNQDKETE